MKQLLEATDPNDLDDLVDRAVNGDAAALELVLGRIHPVVVRYCRSRMSAGHRSLASADDVAQEVCMAVLTALPAFRHEGKPFLAFVYGICAHKVADAHRAAARSRSHPVAEVPDAASADRGPEQSVVAHSTALVIDEMLATLPRDTTGDHPAPGGRRAQRRGDGRGPRDDGGRGAGVPAPGAGQAA